MDRFTELAAFIRTVDRGSQAAAARELGVTPAMVGRYIRGLEDRLGARLLNRSTTTQSLTEAGALFYERAGDLMEQLEAAEAAIDERQAAPRGLLRISAPMVFGVRYLAECLAGFTAAYPAIRLELTLNDRVVDLVDEGYDVAIRIGRLVDSALMARRLAPCRVMLLAAPAYLDRQGTPHTPADLRLHNCLIYAYSATGTAWRLTGPEGRIAEVEIRGTMLANNGDALNAAAVAGAGIVLQPTFIAADAIRAGRLVRILPEWSAPDLALYAVYPSARHLSPKVRALIDALIASFGGPIPPWEVGLENK